MERIIGNITDILVAAEVIVIPEERVDFWISRKKTMNKTPITNAEKANGKEGMSIISESL